MRILVVEDEHKIANSIKKGLEMETFAVDVTYTGSDGFDLASSEDYDLIILDILLPDMNGLTLCKNLRKQKIQTPILMLTAKDQISDKVEGLNAGADDYLTKPFVFEELLARIRALVRREQPTKKNLLTFGNLSLNPLTFEVKKNNQKIDLTRKEFALLEYFLSHPERTLTKEQITSHIWDYDADILPNTVEVFVGYLRRKIGKDSIKTVRGFGYRLG